MSWKRVDIDSIAETVTKGTTPTSIGYDFADQGIPFLRVNNIQNGELDIDDILFIDDKADNALKRSRIKPQDVLLSREKLIYRSWSRAIDCCRTRLRENRH
jgi:type I restriction enzyme, S subunit